MTCEETQKNFSPYLDGRLARVVSAGMEAHLEACPVCRLEFARTRTLVRSLANLERPAVPANLAASINELLLIERAARRQQPTGTLPARLLRWLEPRLMPYTVGAFASLILFIGVVNALRPQFRVLRELTIAAREVSDESLDKSLFEGNGYDVTKPVPTINPNGALAELIQTPSRSDDDDADDMVIYADVFSNGSASLAGVVQPPRNPRLLDEVQEAFRRTPAFVPASLDRRPPTLRVVISVSKVNVHERIF
ncbi:MAG TPA: zf-HC2 domain-containing protein [Pyrinomonadaceae bacterium]|nr:zf-HC2 domain-containing protein [Pyrinomonadaceae bacterium]